MAETQGHPIDLERAERVDADLLGALGVDANVERLAATKPQLRHRCVALLTPTLSEATTFLNNEDDDELVVLSQGTVCSPSANHLLFLQRISPCRHPSECSGGHLDDVMGWCLTTSGPRPGFWSWIGVQMINQKLLSLTRGRRKGWRETCYPSLKEPSCVLS
jgi:hypothetical protein